LFSQNAILIFEKIKALKITFLIRIIRIMYWTLLVF